jgi:hypothetical protein
LLSGATQGGNGAKPGANPLNNPSDAINALGGLFGKKKKP